MKEQKHIKMPSIEQFRHIVYNINRQSAFVEMKDNEPVFDYLRPKPTLTAHGTVKLHGSCSMVSGNDKDIWFQSKKRILSSTEDNNGFYAFCASRTDIFKNLINQASEVNDISLKDNVITIFGEFAGKGIQKGVGIAEIPKSFFIFGCKVTPNDTEKEAYWISSHFLKSPDDRIYNIEDYKTYEVEIDFNHPELVNNKFLEIVKEVENECPVAKEFGISGVGEGVVWAIMYKGVPLRFKTKGEKHSKSKVKTVKPVDLEKLNKIDRCVEEITHEWRFIQALTEVFGVDYEHNINRKRMGEYMKWINKDTLKEEYDIIGKYNLDVKEVMSGVNRKAKEFFFKVEQL